MNDFNDKKLLHDHLLRSHVLIFFNLLFTNKGRRMNWIFTVEDFKNFGGLPFRRFT